MTENQMKKFNVVETLTDAGCNQEMINDFIKIAGNDNEISKWLDKRRTEILDKVHKHTKELDCLDFLIYQIRKSVNTNQNGGNENV